MTPSRAAVAVVTGALLGLVLHRAALAAAPMVPDSWRLVSTVEAPQPTDPTLTRSSWRLHNQALWVSRGTLPGRTVRSLALTANVPSDGVLDVWAARASTEQPRPGDLLLRLHRRSEGGAHLYAWSEDGAHAVGCSPTLGAPSPTTTLELIPEDGVTHVVLNGVRSTCTTVVAAAPPALQSGVAPIVLTELSVDGRTTRGTDPGPLLAWVLLGAFLGLGAARVEATLGMRAWGSALVDAAALCTAAACVLLAPGPTPALAVAQPLVAGALLRATVQVARATRPLAAADWSLSTCVAAALPGAGVIAIGTAGAVLPGATLLASAIAAPALATALATWGSPRPRRRLTLGLGLWSTGIVATRVVTAGSAEATALGAIFLACATATALSIARRDRHLPARAAPVALAAIGLIATAELATRQPEPPPSLAIPAAPVGPLPTPTDHGVLLTGPLALPPHDHTLTPAAHTLRRVLGRAVHPLGDGSWGPEQLHQALELAGPVPHPTVVLTLSENPDPAVASPGPRPSPWLPGLSRAWLSAAAPPPNTAPAALRSIAQADPPVPLVLVTGVAGIDPAAAATGALAAQLAQAHPHIAHVDLAANVFAEPGGGWVDPRGLPSARAWEAVATAIRTLNASEPHHAVP